jgi:hypothetical protein
MILLLLLLLLVVVVVAAEAAAMPRQQVQEGQQPEVGLVLAVEQLVGAASAADGKKCQCDARDL